MKKTFPSAIVRLRLNSELLRHLEQAARVSGATIQRFASELLESEMASRILPTVPHTPDAYRKPLIRMTRAK